MWGTGVRIHAYWRSFSEWIWGRPIVVDDSKHGKLESHQQRISSGRSSTMVPSDHGARCEKCCRSSLANVGRNASSSVCFALWGDASASAIECIWVQRLQYRCLPGLEARLDRVCSTGSLTRGSWCFPRPATGAGSGSGISTAHGGLVMMTMTARKMWCALCACVHAISERHVDTKRFGGRAKLTMGVRG